MLSHPEITVAISGADTSAQMQDNLGALEIELPSEALDDLNQASDRLRVVLDGAGLESDR